MLKSVRFGFMLLDFNGQLNASGTVFMQIYYFFGCYLFVSKERKGCNVLIVLKTCKGSWIQCTYNVDVRDKVRQ